MTVQEYAVKCGVSVYAVYHAVYAGRIRYTRTDGRIDIPDQPFPPDSRLRQADELLDLPEYILSLIWFTGTISGDAILIRNTDRYYIDTVARHISASTWGRKRPDGRDQYVCKIAGVGLVQALHDLGFTGSKDADKQPPPVSTLAFAKAFAETHTSFVLQLRYNRRHPGDKRFAYYVPCISSCASPAILETYAYALNTLGIAPTRKIAPASNGTSALLRYTSNAQLRALHAQLSIDLGSGTHTAFWAAFDTHITQPPIPYFTKNKED